MKLSVALVLLLTLWSSFDPTVAKKKQKNEKKKKNAEVSSPEVVTKTTSTTTDQATTTTDNGNNNSDNVVSSSSSGGNKAVDKIAGSSGITEIEEMIAHHKKAVDDFMKSVENVHVLHDDKKEEQIAKRELEVIMVMNKANEDLILVKEGKHCKKNGNDMKNDNKGQAKAATATAWKGSTSSSSPPSSPKCESEMDRIRQWEISQLATIEKAHESAYNALNDQLKAALVQLELDGRALVFQIQMDTKHIETVREQLQGGSQKKALQQDIADMIYFRNSLNNVLDNDLTKEVAMANSISITEVCIEIVGLEIHTLSKPDEDEFALRFSIALESALASVEGSDMKVLFVEIISQYLSTNDKLKKRLLREVASKTSTNSRRNLAARRTLRMKASAAYTCDCDDGRSGLQSDVVRRLDDAHHDNQNHFIHNDDSIRSLKMSRSQQLWKEFSKIFLKSLMQMFSADTKITVFPSCEALDQPSEWSFLYEEELHH